MIKRLVASIILLAVLIAGGYGLSVWKQARSEAGAMEEYYEPAETIRTVQAELRTHQQTTTAIGTVMALRSIVLQNEIAGTVKEVHLIPGSIVERGDLLIAFDISIETAEMKAQRANLTLAESQLQRFERMEESKAASEIEVEQARAERDIIKAQMERTQAVIERKTLVAPFKAKVGLQDVHTGQYLNAGTEITYLQGVDDAIHVDFRVDQLLTKHLSVGETLAIRTAEGEETFLGEILALDSRVDILTRSTWARLLIADGESLTPGASVVVHVPTESTRNVVAIPASALRRSSLGDHVYVVVADETGAMRAQMRPVENALILNNEVLISAGLTEGEQVATSGSFKLYEGVLVYVEEEG